VRKSRIWTTVAVVFGSITVGVGVKVLVDKDRALCEAAYGRFSAEEVAFDASTGEWRIGVGGVANLGARVTRWEARYSGKTFSSADADGTDSLVSQYSQRATRAGLLGSDFKRLYGARYKHYVFPFNLVAVGGDSVVHLQGVITDPDGSEMPFKVTVELR